MKKFSIAMSIMSVLVFSSGIALAGGVPASSEGGGGTSALPPWEKPTDVDLDDPKRIAAGEMNFQSSCADFCHGREPALFINRDDLEPIVAFKIIYEGGRGATPMPPWGEMLSEEEIWEIVAYIKHLGATK